MDRLALLNKYKFFVKKDWKGSKQFPNFIPHYWLHMYCYLLMTILKAFTVIFVHNVHAFKGGSVMYVPPLEMVNLRVLLTQVVDSNLI